MPCFTFVRAERIRDRPELARIALHGRRLDPTGKRRSDPMRTPFNPTGSAYVDDALDLVGALDGFLAETGAALYKGKPIGLHLLVGVSPDWIRAAGDLHDPANVRNVRLAEEAMTWVEAQLGGGERCVVAWRLDLDEAGGGVVDLIVAPTRVASINKRCRKRIVSVTPALEALHERHPGDTTAFGALQSAWADHAQANLDRALLRGVPRAEKPATHLDPDRFGRLMDAAKAEAERVVAERRAELGAREQELNAAEIQAAEREARLREEEARIDRGVAERQEALDTRERMLARAEWRVGERAEALEGAEAKALRILKQRARDLAVREEDLSSAEARVTATGTRLVASERGVAVAARALALGVAGFVDRRIAAVEHDPETGALQLHPGEGVSPAEWAELMAALSPGFSIGLMQALESLQAGGDRMAQAARLRPGWSPYP